VVRLSADQRRVVQMIYDLFRERGTWPTFGDIDRPLRKRGLKPEAVIDTITDDILLPFQAGRSWPIDSDELRLSLVGIAVCKGGQEDIDIFLRVLPWLVRKELNFKPEEPNTQLRVTRTQIRRFLRLPKDQAAGAISRLRQIMNLQFWGWSNGELANGEWYVQVTREINRCADVRTLDDYLELLDTIEQEHKQPYQAVPDILYGSVPSVIDAVEAPAPQADTYVGGAVIETMRAASTSSRWNCGKLFQLIAELNDACERGNAYSAHAMLRAVLDHVPPLFGFRDFKEITANHRWSQTDKNYMKRLLDFKDQGHDVLHRQITTQADVLAMEDMPQRVAINRLLQECTSKLEES